ncbi:MAG TPA: molybdopterin-dependent oxidoreductase [candidate division Zixibacteria bacterium]|nr:molybdopterin-dependent oxidoreductase [candidate division Zixibacteria bacterium]
MTDVRHLPSRRASALAGLVAGGLGLGVAELLSGLLPGAPSPVTAVGSLVISLQPPGAKQLVVDLFGDADKLVLNLVVLAVALGLAAGLGVLAARSPGLANAGFAVVAGVALLGAVRDPLTDLVLSVLVVGVGLGVTLLALPRLLRAAAPSEPAMPDFERRRFLGRALALSAVAAGSGALGRLLLERRSATTAEVPQVPAPTATAPPLPDGAELDVPGITPLVTPNDEFYRIDTALLTPRVDVGEWRLRVDGMVDRPFEIGYAELLAMPLVEQYVTIACVSNEVGGHLVGNALWRGVRLRELLNRAGVQPGATQVVGRSVDGWTAGFPTAWLDAEGREALVAVAMNGEPLPPQHGYPARLIVPGLYGYVSATKWLSNIHLTTWEGFDGYWVPLGWAKEGPILTQSRIDVPRDRARIPAGRTAVAGVAWAPDRGISAVEVQVDHGGWQPATLSTPISDATWVQWAFSWEATPGSHTLRVRATDGTGEVQTDRVTRPAPDGARGHHTIRVEVG